MAKVKAAVKHVLAAVASKQARGPEIALARIIIGALGIKLGVNFADWVK